MPYIGQVSALFTASTNGLVQGVEKAKRAIDGFKASASKAGGNAGAGIDSLAQTFGKLPFGIGSSLQSLQTFSTGLSSLKTVFGAAGAAGGGMGASLAALAGPFGAVAAGATVAVGAITLLGTGLASVGAYVERTAQLAERLGVSFNTMQKLGLAADYAGGSAEQMAGAFSKMERAVLAASEGDKKALAGLQKLGLSYQELQTMTPEQQFNAAAKALLEIDDPAKRAAAAIALFGKSGLEILPMLKGIAQAQVDMTRLGVAFSKVDVERFSALDDAFDRLGAATGALGRTLLKPFVELFTYTADGFAEFFGGLTAVLDPIAELIAPIGGAIGLVLQIVGKGLNVLGRVIGLVLAPLAAVGTVATKMIKLLSDGFEFLFAGIGATLDWIQNLLSNIPLIGDYFKTNASGVEAGTKAIEEQAAATEEAEKAAKKLGDKWRSEISKAMETPLSNFQKKLDEIAKSNLDPGDAVKAQDIAVQQLVKELDIKLEIDKAPVETFNEQMKALNAITATSAAQEKTLGDARAAATKSFLDSLPDAKEVATPFEEFQKKMGELDAAISGLDPVDNAATIRAIEEKKSRIREEYVNKELGSEVSRRAALEKQLAELAQVEATFANDQTALAGIKEKREKIEKELADMGKAAADAIAKDRERVDALLGKADTKQYTQDIEAIKRERDRAQAAFDEAMQKGNRAAADQAEARLAELGQAEQAAKKAQRDRELAAMGLADIVKPIEDTTTKLRSQFVKLQEAASERQITEQEYQQGIQNLFKEGIDIQKELASEMKTVNQTALKGADVRSSEGIADYIRLATGREDPAIQQRREQLDKLASIESLLREQGVEPATIL